jgi:pimeloyl-ACP methyl ester carboxylesterase
MRVLKWFGILLGTVLAAIFLAFGLLSLRSASTPPIEGPDAVATLERVRLGGLEQTILVRGKDRSSPVLLYLHGGPGFAHLPLAPYYSDELEKHFVVVHWDQRGAGASCEGIDHDELKPEQIVADTIELSALLASRFGGNGRIVLLGHSWGSFVGARAVQERPDLYHAYIGLGQLVNGRRNEVLSYEWVVAEAERRDDQEALSLLRTVSPPYANNDELGVQRRWLMAYGGSVFATDRAQAFLSPLLFGPEYTLANRLSFPGCFSSSINAIWGAIDGLDFPSQIPRLEVPVFFFTGRHDWNTPYPLVEEWAEVLEAPSVEIVWFEESGHMIPMESPAKFQRALIDKVLPLVR